MKGDITRFLVSGMMRSLFYLKCDKYCYQAMKMNIFHWLRN